MYKVLNGFSRDLMKEAFSLHDASILNPDVLIQLKKGTFTGIFSTKDMRAGAKEHEKLRITNNIQISH